MLLDYVIWKSLSPFEDQGLSIETYTRDFIDDKKAIDLVLFHPHQDEVTSLQVGKTFVEENGGNLIAVVDKYSPSTRFITLQHENAMHQVDPNRIFSDNGIKNISNINNEEVFNIIKCYATLITDQLNEYDVVVALHNNDDINYSIRNYLKNGENYQDAKDVYFDSKNGTANFFITNNLEIWNKLKDEGFNAVLYDLKNALDKGYLSFYISGIEGKKYVNIEVKNGEYNQQLLMLNALKTIIDKLD